MGLISLYLKSSASEASVKISQLLKSVAPGRGYKRHICNTHVPPPRRNGTQFSRTCRRNRSHARNLNSNLQVLITVWEIAQNIDVVRTKRALPYFHDRNCSILGEAQVWGLSAHSWEPLTCGALEVHIIIYRSLLAESFRRVYRTSRVVRVNATVCNQY